MKAVIYARYSSSGQREESIEGQLRVCEQYAKLNDYEIIATYCDRAMTGKNDNRPELKKMIADSSKELFQAVIVYSVDRFGRSLYQSMANQYKLDTNGVKIISATESFDDSPSGKMFRHFSMAQAQYFSDELALKVTRGLELNAEKGLSNGGATPFGYRIENKRLQIDSNTALYVKKIFEMYAEGERIADIAKYLNALGIKTSTGAVFNKNSLHSILKNKKYIGVYKYGSVEIPDGVPRIISDTLFNEVAEVLAKNKKYAGRSKSKANYLLTTKLFCGHCRAMMVGFSGKSHTGRVYNYYSCNNKREKLCHKKNESKDLLEDIVIKKCLEILTDENIKRIADEVMAISEREYDNSNLKRLRNLLKQNEKQKANLFESLKLCETDDMRKSIMEELSKMKNAHAEIEKEIAIEEMQNIKLSSAEIRFFLIQLQKGDINDIKHRRTLINLFVHAIYLYDDKITIIFNVGDKLLTQDNVLIDAIENEAEGLYTDGNGVRKKHYF